MSTNPNQLNLRRDPELVRAELSDAFEQWAEVFREKAAMEFSWAEQLELMADKVKAGGHADTDDAQRGLDFWRAYHLIELRFQEGKMRCDRLILELNQP